MYRTFFPNSTTIGILFCTMQYYIKYFGFLRGNSYKYDCIKTRLQFVAVTIFLLDKQGIVEETYKVCYDRNRILYPAVLYQIIAFRWVTKINITAILRNDCFPIRLDLKIKNISSFACFVHDSKLK